MASSEVAIANLALIDLGDSTISALSDSNKRAEACNLIYEQVRDGLIEKFAWRFAIERKHYNGEVDALAGRELDRDNFDDNEIDTDKWGKSELTVGGITETNGRIEGYGGGQWDVNGLITAVAHPLNKSLIAEFTFEAAAVHVETIIGFLAGSVLKYNHTHSCAIYFKSSGLISFMVNGAEIISTYTYMAGKKYKVQILYTDPGWEVYLQSNEDDDYEGPTRILDTSTDSTGPMYFQMQFYTSGASNYSYIDDWILKGEYVPSFEYAHRYRLPYDCLRVIGMYDSTANYTVEKNYIYTSESEFDLKYIKKVTDVTQYPPIFVDCIAKVMAKRLAVRLKGDEAMAETLHLEFKQGLLPEAFKLDAIERNPHERASQSADTSWQREGR